jgi:hypothetical protein
MGALSFSLMAPAHPTPLSDTLVPVKTRRVLTRERGKRLPAPALLPGTICLPAAISALGVQVHPKRPFFVHQSPRAVGLFLFG